MAESSGGGSACKVPAVRWRSVGVGDRRMWARLAGGEGVGLSFTSIVSMSVVPSMLSARSLPLPLPVSWPCVEATSPADENSLTENEWSEGDVPVDSACSWSCSKWNKCVNGGCPLSPSKPGQCVSFTTSSRRSATWATSSGGDVISCAGWKTKGATTLSWGARKLPPIGGATGERCISLAFGGIGRFGEMLVGGATTTCDGVCGPGRWCCCCPGMAKRSVTSFHKPPLPPSSSTSISSSRVESSSVGVDAYCAEYALGPRPVKQSPPHPVGTLAASTCRNACCAVPTGPPGPVLPGMLVAGFGPPGRCVHSAAAPHSQSSI